MLGSYFDGEVFNQVTLQGKTFVKKSKIKDEIIVFNGRTYYIITRSKTMFIIVKCESKNKHPVSKDNVFLRVDMCIYAIHVYVHVFVNLQL